MEDFKHSGIPSTEITIQLNDTVIKFKEQLSNRENHVFVYFDGNPINTPYRNSKISITSSKHFTSLKGKGFEILFDGSKLYTTLDPAFIDATRGLCGTYNFNGADDFTAAGGFIESDIIDFTDSYKSDKQGLCTAPAQADPCASVIGVFLKHFLLFLCILFNLIIV